ncbi:MAG: helix-turn-helix domain-containing protein [Dehalococcoidia bacterium]|nr:helix-turn-helix domain-containing protein [Dehalococcoidia bacterium]
MGLTMRQKAFLSKLLDLYALAHVPLHYSRVAETLGVSAATAYDMLKVLERKGMVRSEYLVADKPTRQGRANIVFAPTDHAHELFARLAGEDERDEEWEGVKARVLGALQEGRASDYDDLVRDVLDLMPRTRSPLAYSAEVITALLLNLYEAKQKFGPRSPLGMLLDNTAGKLGMSMLAGLAFGLSTTRRVNERLPANLPETVRRYEVAVGELSTERAQTLRDFVGEMVAALQPRVVGTGVEED